MYDTSGLISDLPENVDRPGEQGFIGDDLHRLRLMLLAGAGENWSFRLSFGV